MPFCREGLFQTASAAPPAPFIPSIALSDNVLDLEVVGESTKSMGALILRPLRAGYESCQYLLSRMELERAYHDDVGDGRFKIVDPCLSLPRDI